MLPVTVLLRRLFTPKPTQAELDFHWRFLGAEGAAWGQQLMTEAHLSRWRAQRHVKTQRKHSEKVLETWDTDAFNLWKSQRTPEVAPPPPPAPFLTESIQRLTPVTRHPR